MSTERKQHCFGVLSKMSGKKGNIEGFDGVLTFLQEEANTRGLEDDDITQLVEIITEKNIGYPRCVSLVKCLIPRNRAPDEEVQKIVAWCLASVKVISNVLASTILQWLIGLWDNQLIKRATADMFYDVFFYTLLKNKKLGNLIARLIYALTKPEDVTRRQVSRLLALQKQNSRPQKHITALLSLFKSYKPELVPETIRSLNVESVWRPIPEVFRLGLEDARNRYTRAETQHNGQEILSWNVTYNSKSRKKTEPLIPFIYYFHVRSSTYEKGEAKVIFDCTNLKELRKHQLNVELPRNSMSLLVNVAGYHLLTFAEYDYQSRFSSNLYNILRKAFIFEGETYSYEEKDKLLDMTSEFLRYMQQGIPVINRFLDEYLSYNTREHHMKFLALFQWSIFMPVMDLQYNMARHIQTMFYESSLDVKCDIIKSLRLFLTNLFVSRNFTASDQNRPAVFLNQCPTSEFQDIVRVITKIAKDLIVSGLNVHCYNVLLLSEALTFYEETYRLEARSNVPLWTMAPPAVIYGAFVAKSCAILSRVCNLLLRYREINTRSKQLRTRHLFEKEIYTLNVYAKDLAKALWYDKTFSAKDDGYFLNSLPDDIVEELAGCQLDLLLNISNHCAFVPFKWSLRKAGLGISTKKDLMSVAVTYYPAVSNFCKAFCE